jgi:HlyD family secretion protein
MSGATRWVGGAAGALVLLAACRKAETGPPYEKVSVQRRDIVVSATATGVLQPILTLSVKSKASGEILDEPVQTGDEVKKGQLLAKIDPRIPQNNLAQADANLAVAQAQLANATAQLKRSEELFRTQSITQAGLDSAELGAATARAAVATAQANLQTARDAMQDTHVLAPITGTVLELDAVLGTVISSPTNDVGGGTVILKMANLDTVQISALVDETDVAKVQPRMAVTIAVDAYQNRTFDGSVLKIEPQAQVNQNVTMFPVEVNILNPEHLLKPGMNAEVEIHVGQRQGALAVPNAALRTPKDVASAASVLGLDPRAVERQLAAVPAADREARSSAEPRDDHDLHAAEPLPRGAPSGGTPATQGNAIVFVLRGGKIVPVAIGTGLTDLDYTEVTAGLADRDTVLVLGGGGAR